MRLFFVVASSLRKKEQPPEFAMPTTADKANDYRLPGAGTRRSSRIGRRPSSKTVDSQGKNKAAAISKQAKKININAEPVAKDSSQQNDVKAEPVAKDSTQQNDSQNSIKRRRSTKDTIILKYKSISFAEQVKYYLITVALCSIPFVTYGLAFTQIGYGIQLLQFLNKSVHNLNKSYEY